MQSLPMLEFRLKVMLAIVPSRVYNIIRRRFGDHLNPLIPAMVRKSRRNYHVSHFSGRPISSTNSDT
jgi:hypothetical protein